MKNNNYLNSKVSGPKLKFDFISPYKYIQEKLTNLSTEVHEKIIPKISHLNNDMMYSRRNVLLNSTEGIRLTNKSIEETQTQSSPNKIAGSHGTLLLFSKNNISVNVFENKIDKKENFKFFHKIIDHFIFDITIFILTIFALFSQDIKILAGFPSKIDNILDIFSIICFSFFLIEIILSIFAKDHYLFSFFFWLDFISTLSILFDISILQEKIFSRFKNVDSKKN